jgi:hypothetical protein
LVKVYNMAIQAEKSPAVLRRMLMTELRTAVVTELMSIHDFTIDEAEEAVGKSLVEDEEIWHEEADPKEVAKFLASDESDE